MSRDASTTRPSPYVGPSSNQGGRVVDLNRRSKVAVIIFIVVIILLIIAIIIIAILRSRSTTSTSTTTTTTGCKINSDCSNSQVCNTSNNTCVNCLAKSDCKTTANPVCNTSTHTCVNCLVKADCTSTANPFCNASNNTCVQCLSNTDCTESGFICTNNVCVIHCTAAPNVVTNLQITSNSGTMQQVLTWTPATGGDSTVSYIVSQAANTCPSTVGQTTSTKTIPFGTNTATFTGLAVGTYCYVVQSQNTCGTSSFALSPSVQGTICGSTPTAPSGTATYTLQEPGCEQQVCDFSGCSSTCPGSGKCSINFTHTGAGPGPLFGDIYTTTNVAAEVGGSVLSNSELITSLPADPSYSYFYFRYAQCGVTTNLTAQRVNNWIPASNITVTGATSNGNVVVASTNVGKTFASIPANPTVSWPAIANVDEYTITIRGTTVSSGSITFGTRIPSSSTSYTFVGPISALTSASVFVFGYTNCNISSPITIKSITV